MSGSASVASTTTASTGADVDSSVNAGANNTAAVKGNTCIFSGLHGGSKVHPSGPGGSPRGRSPRAQRADKFGKYSCTLVS